MNKSLALIALLLAAACASTDSYMQSWVGKPVSDVVAVWGAPVRQFQMADGSLNYTWSTYYTTGGFSNECRRSFTVDDAQIIKSYSYSGCPEVGLSY